MICVNVLIYHLNWTWSPGEERGQGQLMAHESLQLEDHFGECCSQAGRCF